MIQTPEQPFQLPQWLLCLTRLHTRIQCSKWDAGEYGIIKLFACPGCRTVKAVFEKKWN